MKEDKKVFASNLRQLRLLHGMSMEDLSGAINKMVSKQSISKYEKGIVLPSYKVIYAMANIFNVSPDYLLTSQQQIISTLEVLPERDSNLTSKQFNALVQDVNKKANAYMETESLLHIKRPKIPSIPETTLVISPDARIFAVSVRKKWKMDCRPITSVYALLESKGVHVLHMELPETIDCISVIANKAVPFVVVNKKTKDHGEKRVAVMRELCRIFGFVQSMPNISRPVYSNLCEEFAEEMLLPSSVLEESFKPGEPIALHQLTYLQAIYGVSAERIIRRLNELGIINDRRMFQCMHHMYTTSSFCEQVRNSCYYEPDIDQFKTFVCRAAAMKIITQKKAAELLGVNESEFNEEFFVV